MGALAANADRACKSPGGLQSIPVENSVHIYKGAEVAVNAAGFAQPMADTAGFKFAGIAYEECDNTLTGSSQGGKSVRVYTEGTYLFAAATITQAMVGEVMYAVDDNTVEDASTEMIPVGVLAEYVSGTSGWVKINVGAGLPGKEVPVVTTAVARTMTTEESGCVIGVTADAVITLPATKKGVEYTFIAMGAATAVEITLASAAADAFHGGGLTSTDDKDLVNTKGTMAEGDYVKLVGDGVDGWWIVGLQGTWAKEAD